MTPAVTARERITTKGSMCVLQANKFFYLRGGAERCYFDTIDGLDAREHRVVPFSMRHERNRPTPYADDFVSEVDFHGRGGAREQITKAKRFIHSNEAKERMLDLLHRERPDVAHLHNIAHQLTPAIIDACREQGVPVVQTLHDYKLICSSYLLTAHGKPCDRCRGGRHYQAVRTRCHHGSLAKSVLGFAEMGWHALRGSYRGVHTFLCPSRFMRDTCVTFGIDSARLVHLPYLVDAARYEPNFEPGDAALFVGRLSHEKGVSTLLDAAVDVKMPLEIAGEGPLRDELEDRAAGSGAQVTFHGYLDESSLHDTIRRAAFVIVPSEWYENLPFAVLESFALGKPVLGSHIGGIPEMVRPGETGFLFPAGNARALAAAWRDMAEDRDGLRAWGRRARALIETEYGPDRHFDRLETVYRRVAA